MTVKKVKVATWSQLEDRKPIYSYIVTPIRLKIVVVRFDNKVSVFHKNQVVHEDGFLSDIKIMGKNLVYVLEFRYELETGISTGCQNKNVLDKFSAWVEESEDAVYVDEEEIIEWDESLPF